MAVTWDPLNIDSNMSLSNGDLTVDCDTADTNQCAISEWSKSSGKWYWEMAYTGVAGTTSSFGVCDASGTTDFNNNDRAGWNESWAYMGNNRLYHDGGLQGTAPGHNLGTTETLQVALDIDNGKIWFGVNNTWFNSGDPATGANPSFTDATMVKELKACVTLRYTTDSIVTAFSSADQTYTAPTGFNALDATATLPLPTEFYKHIRTNHINLRR